MCGRFVAARPVDALAERFAAEPGAAGGRPPSWNVAPTASAAVVTTGGGARRLEVFRWGLVPATAESPAGASRLINARIETAAAKPPFREPLARRRCIVPVDGFYEWERRGAARRPYYFTRPDGDVLALAGVWDTWRDGDGSPVSTFAILTTAALAPVDTLHSRMPVVLDTVQWAEWLGSGPLDPADIDRVSRPVVSLTCWPVATEVNSTRRDGPHLTRPAVAEAEPLSLFP